MVDEKMIYDGDVGKSDEERYLEDTVALKADFQKYMYHPMRDRVFAGLLLDKKLCELVINAVTGIRFEVEKIYPQCYEPGELNQGRTIILDIKALDPAGMVCNLEVQVRYYPGGSHEKRVVFHGCRILSKQLNKSEDFSKVRSVAVIFFNFESASERFIRDIALRDDEGVIYSDLLRLYEVNTMENAGATADQQFAKIFSFFLLYACDREKFYAKLTDEGIDHENEIVNMLMRVYEALIGNEQVKEELKIMEMTTEDGIFLASRNFADVRAEGMEKGMALGEARGLEKGMVLGEAKIIKACLSSGMAIEEISHMTGLSVEKISDLTKFYSI